MYKMANLIINGSFETGAFPPWLANHAFVTNQFAHTGSFSAELEVGDHPYILQTFAVNAGDTLNVSLFLAKNGIGFIDDVLIQVVFYDVNFTFLSVGLAVTVLGSSIPNASQSWENVQADTTMAPIGTTQAMLLIASQKQNNTRDLLVDDVSVNIAGQTGSTGPTGP
ncbi:hypothetical protein CN602_29545, partial [Bacillus cereus]